MTEITGRILEIIQKDPWLTDATVARRVGVNRKTVARARASFELARSSNVKEDEIFTRAELERLDEWLIERGLLFS